ncbi:MAG TPA: 3'-5' exonuclease [Candidatus Acidoferrales bacterium]|nr:3'-5' exonuclease [Candidatus Acidoferrales bacterium]
MAELQRLATLAPDWNWARCAVIAREWRYLQPVRSYCERKGVPIQMANEDTFAFWRLRETQALLDWLRRDDRKEIDTATTLGWIATQSSNPWWSLLAEAVQAHGLETAGTALPVQHLMDWLADWGRQVRRRQSGLLLTTAHRAKGLEFDHVVVLDGGWDKTSAHEDGDAARRLYYVAMTRARQTLTLARMEGRKHRFLDDLPPSRALQWREPAILPSPAPDLAWRHEPLTLADVDLGYAGRRSADDAIHAAIAALQPDDALSLDVRSEKRLLKDRQGRTIGKLARKYQLPEGMERRSARVVAVLVRREEDCDEAHRHRLQCTRWEVVVPELIFAPAADHVPSRPGSHEQIAAHSHLASPMVPIPR